MATKTPTAEPKPERDNELLQVTILAAMDEGKSLRAACAENDLSVTTFLLWVDSDPELAEHYTRARARLLDFHAEELEAIGERAANAETAVEVQGLRLLSDNRKWILSKLAPKKYGDKLAIGGADDLPPIRTMDLTALSPEELTQMEALLAKAKATE